MKAIIATWLMAEEGVKLANDKTNAEEMLLELIKNVEDNELYSSVGFGGLPNKEGICQFDSAFMDGKDLSYGAVGAIENIKNPIEVAYHLKDNEANNFLVAKGAFKYAIDNGFKEYNMLSEKAKARYQKRLISFRENNRLKAYDGHDTVGAIALDNFGHMVAGTSTSGLFFKKDSRIGDSPILGSGLYVDELIGGACATGVGEDITKSCISYEIVRLMKQHHPKEACKIAVTNFIKRMRLANKEVRDISVVALNNKGEFGAYSNIDTFSFVISINNKVKVYRFIDGAYIEVENDYKNAWLKTESGE